MTIFHILKYTLSNPPYTSEIDSLPRPVSVQVWREIQKLQLDNNLINNLLDEKQPPEDMDIQTFRDKSYSICYNALLEYEGPL